MKLGTLNRAVARLALFEKDADSTAFERMMTGAMESVPFGRTVSGRSFFPAPETKMAKRIPTKRSVHELTRLVERAVRLECKNLSHGGLWFCVTRLEASGQPPSTIRVSADLHFTAESGPYCCGEPRCHLALTDARLDGIGERLRRTMKLTQPVPIEFIELRPVYHGGVRFQYGHADKGSSDIEGTKKGD